MFRKFADIKNPLFSGGNSLYVFVIVWVVFISTHTFLLNTFFEIPFSYALSDSVCYDGLFALMSVNLWYTVRFLKVEIQDIRSFLISHISIASLFIFFWISIGNFIMYLFHLEDVKYLYFLEKDLSFRIFSGVFYYCLLILIYYLQIYYLSFRQKQIQEAQLKSLVKETELSLLKSQLNPHFIFNSLNSISSLTMSSPSLAQEMVIKLSSYIRYALTQDDNKLVDFAEELENSQLYLEIEKVRFGDRFELEIDCQAGYENLKIPNMILQPILENAIKHGVYESLTQVLIEISCKSESGFLIVGIKNTFDGSGTQMKGHGIGLKNVKQRMHLTYGLKDLVNIEIKKNEFIVELKFPQ